MRVAGEVFADRGYADDGTLAPRGRPGAMIEDAERWRRARALEMVEKRYVTSLSGKPIPVSPDTCACMATSPAR